MNEKKNKLIRVISASVSSLLTAVVGVLYIISCIGIWRSGASPFTRESVGDALMKLLIPSIAAIVLMIATAVLFILFPVKEKKKAVIETKDTRDILARKITLSECTRERANAIVNEKNRRAFLRVGCIVLLILSLVYPTVYLLTPDNFGVTDINTDVLMAALHVILSFIPLTAYVIISSYMIRSSYGREAELLRGAIKEKASVDKDELYDEKSEKKPFSSFLGGIRGFFKKNEKIILTVTRCAVLIIGVAFVIVGIFNGGMKDVLDKAVNICRECIGLG